MKYKISSQVGSHTKKEILQQPISWMNTYKIIRERKESIIAFLKSALSDNVDIILTGAGSSAFIGEAMQGEMLKRKDFIARSIATTDILTHPELFLSKRKKTLLVSFARSGNSPESIAAIRIVNKYCTDPSHLIITCNPDGQLYLETENRNTLKILLSPETNDESLAMTSSFTSMMLAYILIARIDTISEEETKVKELALWIETMLSEKSEAITNIAKLDFKRVVFLGSGPLQGTAHESHLKLQELTDGNVICKFDTFLGFRHGPKVVINDKTLIVYLFSDDEVARHYEIDLVQQINCGNVGMAQVSVSSKPVQIENFLPTLEVCYQSMGEVSDISYLCVAHVVFAQLLGFYKSVALGLDPDSPSVSGTISRVVEGVNIYI
jgi:tagatose-6-phosphate ketose/aldose isomerase